MPLKVKLILLTLLPLLLISGAIGWIAIHQATSLGEKEVATFRASLIAAKEQALKDTVDLALDSIHHIYQQAGPDDAQAKAEVTRILSGLRYGDDGYFFVYHEDGTNLAHPILPELVGKNLIDLQDTNGDYLIRALIETAKSGGGFHQYLWHKPSSEQIVTKLSYAAWLPKWQWMIGTGLYIEDIRLQMSQVEQAVQANIQTTFISVIVLVAITTLLILIATLAINLHEHRLADSRLKELAHKTVMFQEEEKKHVARELHDGVNQLLVSGKCHLELLKHQLMQTNTEQALYHRELSEAAILQAIAELRRISHNLRPSSLDDIGLVAALDNLLNDFAASTGTRINRSLTLNHLCLPTDVMTTLYRVAQESLVNISKHAHSEKIDIELSVIQNTLQFIIRDHGIGFDVQQAMNGKGIGLRNMRERLEFLGGELDISSQPGEGTEVMVNLPLTTDSPRLSTTKGMDFDDEYSRPAS
ncbi:cache domain-containing protein [Photobacterium sp. GJ3]|uniref:cache domain-containing protein n=1 Tax=Photobacterium sp. GJ3 TaxID=2829502 RepID=UPI001B8B900F|nr:cache domain-containing protein [Photobacterium sp. GJ3]QUJ69076.1 cache domain-containing protein [Photobacterium sp. GJ3]